MAIDPDRELDAIYRISSRIAYWSPKGQQEVFFAPLNELLSRILSEGTMADFQVFFNRVILPASENGAAPTPSLVDWRQACRDFAYYIGNDSYRAIVDGGWISRFEKPHVLWFFRTLLLHCREGREALIDRIVEDRRIATEKRALFCHAAFKAEVTVVRHGRDFIDLPRFWHCNRSICDRVMDTKNCVQHEAIKNFCVPRHGGRLPAALEKGVAGDNYAVFEINRELENRRIGGAMLEHLIRSHAVRCFTGLLAHHPEAVFKLRSPEEWLVTVCRCAGDDFAVATVKELERQFPGIVGRTRDPWGNTPLWNTFINPNPTATLRAELLRFGCDPDAKNEWELSYRLVRDNDPKVLRRQFEDAPPPGDDTPAGGITCGE